MYFNRKISILSKSGNNIVFAMLVTVQESFPVVQLSILIILLIILLTCASKRKGKTNVYGEYENAENGNVKNEYLLMCFPCLKKKPDVREIENAGIDLTDQYEYVVEKYTIRKVPLSIANTPEDLLQRHKEMQNAYVNSYVEHERISRSKFQDVYGMQEYVSCMPVTEQTSSRRSVKERLRPNDVLDSSGLDEASSSSSRKFNYVAIPSKASLHSKDVMMTKREITNQYLNNFSSFFVDDLKDPENFPNFGRPCTSAIKRATASESSRMICTAMEDVRGRRDEELDESEEKESEENVTEEGEKATEEEEGKEFEAPSKDEERTEPFPTEETFPIELSKIRQSTKKTFHRKNAPKSKESLFKVRSARSPSSASDVDPEFSEDSISILRSESQQMCECKKRMLHYDEIRTIDVGYDFSNDEKFGVKPKMTRLGSYEPLRDSISSDKDAAAGSNPTQKSHDRRISFSGSRSRSSRLNSSTGYRTETVFLNPPILQNTEKPTVSRSSRGFEISDALMTCKLRCEVKTDKETAEVAEDATDERNSKMFFIDAVSPSRTSTSRKQSENEIRHVATTRTKSRSFENIQYGDQTPTFQLLEKKINGSLDETETTASVITTPRSSEPDLTKRATLRWKIIIKHQKDEDSEKKG